MTTPSTTDTEEIEGLDEDNDASWGDYPIDTFLIRTEARTVFDVLRRIEQGSYVMNPEFQRDFIWDDTRQSRLIESVLMRVPLPVFYLAEDLDGRMVVVDGLQRLSTFQRFHKGEFRLKLPSQPLLHKKRFAELSPKLQNRIEDCNLTLYIIDAKVPERARLDIFDRVNSGLPLTRQQMRNSLYNGPATRFLRDEAESEMFKAATGKSLRAKTMRDREFVNRFCAFQLLSLDDYRQDMDAFLALALKKMNKLPVDQLEQLSVQFRRSLANNFAVFGKHAFRKHTNPDDSRSVLNASLWDVMSTGLSQHSEPVVEAKAQVLRDAFFPLMDNEGFIRSITYGPNTTAQVKHRFAVAQQLFSGVFGADAT